MNTTPTKASPAGRMLTMRFNRDKATWVRYGQLGLFAFLIDGYAPTVPLLAAELNLSLPVAALHGTAFGIGMLIAGTFSAHVSRRIGRSMLSWTGVTGICAGVIAYLSGTSPLVTLAGIGLAGICGALMLAAANADLSERHGPAGPRALNEAAAVSQGAGIAAPLLIGVLAATFVGWRGGLLVIVLMAVTLGVIAAFSRRSHAARYRGGIRAHEISEAKRSRASKRLPIRFAVAWTSNVVVLGIEFSLMMWTPSFLAAQTGLSTSLATASIAVTLTGMMLGRFAFALFTRHENLDRLLVLAIAIFLSGFAVFWVSSEPIISVCALFITGLGISAQYPLSLARLIQASQGKPDIATGWGATAMGLALATAPLLLGILGAALGIKVGILLPPALGVLTLILVALSPTRKTVAQVQTA